jgi:hypothetical protein
LEAADGALDAGHVGEADGGDGADGDGGADLFFFVVFW